MSNNKGDSVSEKKTAWQRPSMKYVGHVGEIFQFPGGGKLSLVADDMGDEQRKPSGQEK